MVFAVARLTYGFNKRAAAISYGHLSRLTGISRVKVIPLIKNLLRKKVLGSTNNGTRKPLTIWINKDYDEWLHSPKKGTSPIIRTTASPNNGYEDSPNLGTPLKKERQGKEKTVPRSKNLNGGPSPLPPEQTQEQLLYRYSEPEREIIAEAFKALGSTRRSGKLSHGIRLAELNYWAQFEVWKVVEAIRIYLAKEYHLEGKKEEYLRGIIRDMKPQTRKGNGAQPAAQPQVDRLEDMEHRVKFSTLPEAERRKWRDELLGKSPAHGNFPEGALNAAAADFWHDCQTVKGANA